jgi:hypothetical protein
VSRSRCFLWPPTAQNRRCPQCGWVGASKGQIGKWWFGSVYLVSALLLVVLLGFEVVPMPSFAATIPIAVFLPVGGFLLDRLDSCRKCGHRPLVGLEREAPSD